MSAVDPAEVHILADKLERDGRTYFAATIRALLAEVERQARIIEQLAERFAARIATLEGLVKAAVEMWDPADRPYWEWLVGANAYWASLKGAANGTEAVLLEAQEGEG